jgi:predicted nucleic acid-binding Zn ribbon protein
MRRIDESRACLAWEALVGPSAARFSQALRVRQGTLIVRVPDPLWMQQLSLLKYELLKKYRAKFPQLQIKDIYFTRT